MYARALARASQRYFAELFFDSTRSATRGPLCALDVDGVLETEGLGFSSLTAPALSAFARSSPTGIGRLLVSGRSLAEVRDRCSAFGLAGGVAEYGSAFYDHELGTVGSLLTADAQLNDLEQLRRRHSVRWKRFVSTTRTGTRSVFTARRSRRALCRRRPVLSTKSSPSLTCATRSRCTPGTRKSTSSPPGSTRGAG